MKTVFVLFFLFVCAGAFSQKDSLLIRHSVAFHQKLVLKDEVVKDYLDDYLTYGHSNGWLESKQDVLANLQSGKIRYDGIREDSMTAVAENEIGWVRFVADMNVILDGKQLILRIKVLEIWVKKTGGWKLFARQAVRV